MSFVSECSTLLRKLIQSASTIDYLKRYYLTLGRSPVFVEVKVEVQVYVKLVVVVVTAIVVEVQTGVVVEL